MRKYIFSSHHLDTRNELSYLAIANELAEANRLKRIELSLDLAFYSKVPEQKLIENLNEELKDKA